MLFLALRPNRADKLLFGFVWPSLASAAVGVSVPNGVAEEGAAAPGAALGRFASLLASVPNTALPVCKFCAAPAFAVWWPALLSAVPNGAAALGGFAAALLFASLAAGSAAASAAASVPNGLLLLLLLVLLLLVLAGWRRADDAEAEAEVEGWSTG
jgi:hypothetical protein